MTARWDGTFRGAAERSGVFTYLLKIGYSEYYVDKSVTLQGNVSLLR